MTTNTPNYALVKPAYSDWADITVLNKNADIIDTQLFAKASKTRQIIAGLGLTGGGDLTTDRTLNITSANAGIVVNSDNIELKPATTSIIGGVKPKVGNGGGSTYNATTGEFYVPLDYKQYDSLTALGLTLPCSTIKICDAMPIRSYLCTSISIGNMSDSPNDYGLLEIIKFDTTRASCKFNRKDGFNLYFASRDSSIPFFSGWKEVSTQEFTDATYVKKAGDTMTGGLTATALAATNGTNTAAIYARYNGLATDQIYMYNNSTTTGIYSLMPTVGETTIFSRNKSTGVVTYASGTFNGDITAPNLAVFSTLDNTSLTSGTTYTNTTGKPMMITAREVNNGNAAERGITITINGNNVSAVDDGSNSNLCVTAICPANGTYKVLFYGTSTSRATIRQY